MRKMKNTEVFNPPPDEEVHLTPSPPSRSTASGDSGAPKWARLTPRASRHKASFAHVEEALTSHFHSTRKECTSEVGDGASGAPCSQASRGDVIHVLLLHALRLGHRLEQSLVKPWALKRVGRPRFSTATPSTQRSARSGAPMSYR